MTEHLKGNIRESLVCGCPAHKGVAHQQAELLVYSKNQDITQASVKYEFLQQEKVAQVVCRTQVERAKRESVEG